MRLALNRPRTVSRTNAWPNWNSPELNSLTSPAVTLRLPNTDIAAGIVVAAPMATSVSPTARRRSAGMRSASSRPRPNPSAARVATTNPSNGGVSVSVVVILKSSTTSYANAVLTAHL